MRRTHLYASARARRILAGGAVTPAQVSARTWGRDALSKALGGVSCDDRTLHERLRGARAKGYTLAALFKAPFPYPAPFGAL